jgi:hypothetical protein
MARKYSKGSAAKVERAMKKRKKGTLRSGSSGKKVTSRKQAIAIGLSEARRERKKVPAKKSKAPTKKSLQENEEEAKSQDIEKQEVLTRADPPAARFFH